MKRTMNWVERAIVYGLLGVLFLIGIFLDLPISQGLYAPDSLFGQIMELTAEIPVWVLILFSLALIVKFHPDFSKDWANILFLTVVMAGGLFVAYYAGHHFLKLLNRVTHQDLPSYLSFVYALVYLAISCPWVFLLKEEHRREMMVFATLVIAMLGTTLLLMQGLKMLWLRPRFRTLMALGGEEAVSSLWCPIYKINGFWNFDSSFSEAILDERFGAGTVASAMENLGVKEWAEEEFYAFPSGHTMHAVAPLMFCMASGFLPKMKGKEGYVRIPFYAWGILAAVGRIVRGAHHLTDVTFGFFVAVIVFDMYSSYLEKPFLKLYDRFVEEGKVKTGEKNA